jgi:hypothetical protein
MKKYLSNDFDFTGYVNVSDECSIWQEIQRASKRL